MNALHQPPAELREAEAMDAAKRSRKSNCHRPHGQGDHTYTRRDLKSWGSHRDSSKITSTVLPAPVS